MNTIRDAHDMSPPDAAAADIASIRRQAEAIAAPYTGPDHLSADLESIRQQAEQVEPQTVAQVIKAQESLTLEQIATVRQKLERDHREAASALEPFIERAVTDARIEGDSWERIANLLGMHKDTARRQYQGRSIDAGAPGPRITRCGLQHADAAGWCRNGVAGLVKRADGKGPAMYICRPHGDKGVRSGKYVWHQPPGDAQ